MTRHTVEVIFERDDREDAIHAGEHTFEGKPYDTFGAAAARQALIDEGVLALGPDLITFQGTLVPTAKVDRIRVEIVAKSRSPEAS